MDWEHMRPTQLAATLGSWSGTFEGMQIIPGLTPGNVKVTCIDSSTDTGKIVASYRKKVYIFEPTPIAADSSHYPAPRWSLKIKRQTVFQTAVRASRTRKISKPFKGEEFLVIPEEDRIEETPDRVETIEIHAFDLGPP